MEPQDSNPGRIDRFKAHVSRHKTIWSVGTIVVVAGVSYYLGVRIGSSSAGSSNTLNPVASIFGINNKLDQKVITLVDRKGPPSWVVYCKETKEEFLSAYSTARAHGIRESDLRAHLNGYLDDVNGKHYVRRGLAAAA